jgi:hypothetical protein
MLFKEACILRRSSSAICAEYQQNKMEIGISRY